MTRSFASALLAIVGLCCTALAPAYGQYNPYSSGVQPYPRGPSGQIPQVNRPWHPRATSGQVTQVRTVRECIWDNHSGLSPYCIPPSCLRGRCKLADKDRDKPDGGFCECSVPGGYAPRIGRISSRQLGPVARSLGFTGR